MIEHLFPGGRGRLRLVDDRRSPKPVLGGAGLDDAEPDEDPDAPGREPEEADGEDSDEFSSQGVEIEVTPAGKATRRLSLLSGGEKSLVALAFVFARLPRPPVALLHPRRGRGGARRRQHRPLPAARPPLLRPRPVRHRHPPEADDGRRRRALRRQHGQGRRDQGRLAPASPREPGSARRGRADEPRCVASRADADRLGRTARSRRRPGRRGDAEPEPEREPQGGAVFRAPAREPLEEPPGAAAPRSRLEPLRQARRRDLGAARGGADPRRRRRADDRRGRRAARGRGRGGRGQRRRRRPASG